MVCSMQTMHLPCIRISSISKLTEPSFHLSLFTQEHQIVRPKWILRLWCIRRKLCTYLALKLTMSTNGPKQDSIWHTSSRSSIGCVKMISMHIVCFLQTMHFASRLALSPNKSNWASTWASSPRYQQVLPKWFLRLWCIRRKPCTYLAPKLTLFLNRPKQDSIWHVIKEFHRVHPNWFPCIWYVPCKPCTYLASRLALSPNRPNRASTWASSSRSTNRCVKNGFLDYGALGTNYAPILHKNRPKQDSIWHVI